MEWFSWNSIVFLEIEVNGFEGKFFVEVWETRYLPDWFTLQGC